MTKCLSLSCPQSFEQPDFICWALIRPEGMSLSWMAVAGLEFWTLDCKMFRIWCNFASASYAEFWRVIVNPETKGSCPGVLLENRKAYPDSKMLVYLKAKKRCWSFVPKVTSQTPLDVLVCYFLFILGEKLKAILKARNQISHQKTSPFTSFMRWIYTDSFYPLISYFIVFWLCQESTAAILFTKSIEVFNLK